MKQKAAINLIAIVLLLADSALPMDPPPTQASCACTPEDFAYEALIEFIEADDYAGLKRVFLVDWNHQAKIRLTYSAENFEQYLNNMTAQEYLEADAPIKSYDFLFTKMTLERKENFQKKLIKDWLVVHRALLDLILELALRPALASCPSLERVDAIESYLDFLFEPVATARDDSANASPYDSRNYRPSIKCPPWFAKFYEDALEKHQAKFNEVFTKLDDIDHAMATYPHEHIGKKAKAALEEKGFMPSLESVAAAIVNGELAKLRLDQEERSAIRASLTKEVCADAIAFLTRNALMHSHERRLPEQIWLQKDFAFALQTAPSKIVKMREITTKKVFALKREPAKEIYYLDYDAFRRSLSEAWNICCWDNLRKCKAEPKK